jgi:ATP-binding protein involved in chromosome partitioning
VTGADTTEPGEPGTEPASIDVDREVGVTLTWPDGRVDRFELLDLRVNCPCAECRERRRAHETVWPKPGSPEPLRLLDARLVGAFGMAFEWNDGHGTGIYTWDIFRAWAGA